MKIVNSKGEVIADLSSKKEAPKSKEDQTEKRIKDRGTIQETAKKIVTEKSALGKAGAALETLNAPLASVESGIANMALETQKGNKAGPMAMAGPVGTTPEGARDMGKMIKEALLGAALQKQGQYGDVMKNMGWNPVLSDTAGLVLSMAPLAVYGHIAKTFGAISKMSDKAMLKAGDNLVNAVNQATDAAGTKLNQAFASGADNVPIDGIAFIENITKLPKSVLAHAEDAFGDLADFANGLTVGKVREFKRFLGKLRPSAYGQEARGMQETIDVVNLNKVYAGLKQSMRDSIKGQMGDEAANGLMQLETAFSEVMDAGRYIRKNIVDPILEEPTKVGQLAKKVASDADVAPRMALNKIKSTSRKAMENINKAMGEIERFNRNKAVNKVAKGVASSVIYGAAAGSIAGRISKSFNQENA